MKTSNMLFQFTALLLISTNSLAADKPEGKWLLQIENKKHQIVTTMTIRFTDIKAPSCLEGNWLNVVVDSLFTKDSTFFPIDDLISYEIVNKNISIGRNTECDGYLHLIGKLDPSKIIGEYVTVGWTSQKLGYFSLEPINEK